MGVAVSRRLVKKLIGYLIGTPARRAIGYDYVGNPPDTWPPSGYTDTLKYLDFSNVFNYHVPWWKISNFHSLTINTWVFNSFKNFQNRIKIEHEITCWNWGIFDVSKSWCSRVQLVSTNMTALGGSGGVADSCEHQLRALKLAPAPRRTSKLPQFQHEFSCWIFVRF